MTETRWLACDDPGLMLEFVWDRVSDRKLRLFAVSCCRRLWHYLDDEKGRAALETIERATDAGPDDRALWNSWSLEPFAHDALHGRIAAQRGFSEDVVRAAFTAVALAMHVECAEVKSTVFRVAHIAGAQALGPRADAYLLYQLGKDVHLEDEEHTAAEEAIATEQTLQIALIHDICGNPFRRVAFDSSWRTSTAVALAAQMYESRDFSAMPILADALQDAGCENGEILDHCRGPGPHVRGCWVCDLVLGRE